MKDQKLKVKKIEKSHDLFVYLLIYLSIYIYFLIFSFLTFIFINL